MEMSVEFQSEISSDMCLNDLIKPGAVVAFDENISDRKIGKYARFGCTVVHVAKQGDPDEIWVMEAYSKGAEVCFSYDRDVGNIIDKENMEGMTWRYP